MKTLKTDLSNSLENCYILYGDDYYLYDRAFLMIKKRCTITIEEFNVVKFDDENFSMQGVLDACEVMPIADEKKIVIIKNIAKLSENDKKMFENYLNNQVSSTILVVFDYLNVFSFVKENARRVNCNRFEKDMAIKFIANELAKKNKQITLDGAEALLMQCNGFLTRVVNELDKLAYYDMDDPIITKKLVEALVSKDEEFQIFELTEALGRKNGDKAIKVLEAMIKEQGVFGLITNHFRRLFFIANSNLSDAELASMLGVKEYAIKKQKEQVKNFSKMQLKKIYSLLDELDFKIKSGQVLQENALYMLVFSILNN